MQLTLITPPEAPAVSLADMKDHLRYSSNAEDDYIAACVAAAQGYLEGRDGRLNRAFLLQTWQLSLPRWWRGVLSLPFAPLHAVEQIRYRTQLGAEVVLDPALYEVSTASVPGVVRLAPGSQWPTDIADRMDAVTIEFTCGHETSGDLHPSLIAAIKLMAADLFNLREGAVVGTIHTVNPAVERLLAPHHVYDPHARRFA